MALKVRFRSALGVAVVAFGGQSGAKVVPKWLFVVAFGLQRRYRRGFGVHEVGFGCQSMFKVVSEFAK